MSCDSLITRLAIVNLAIVWLTMAVGCAATAPPTSGEIATIKRGDQALILIRIAVRNARGAAIEPFSGSLADDNVGIGSGNFESGGKIRQRSDIRFLSERSRANGWFFVVAPRGTHYFAFLPPRRTDAFSYAAHFSRIVPWRVDSPTTADVIYAGTLVADGKTNPLLFGGDQLTSFDIIGVQDESDKAQALMRRFMPGVERVETTLMVRHTGPLIFNTPKQ